MDNRREKPAGKHEHPLRHEISEKEKNTTRLARNEAMKDIDQDADFSIHSPNDDLDEGESARLGENNTGLV